MKLDQVYMLFLPDMFNKVAGFANWGHHQMLDPNKPFKTSRFVEQTKNALLNFNSLLLSEEIEED